MSKNRILVVEDDLETAASLRSYFEWQGYEVITTNLGTEALELCRLKLPNAVILDIVLPDLNGYEVCRGLRRQRHTSHVPVLFLSYKNKRSEIIAAFEAGGDDYVVKPFDLEELNLRIEGAIRYSRRGSSMHPVTNLPAGELVTDQLKTIKESPEPWVLLYFNIHNLGVFKAVSDSSQVNGFLLSLADVLRASVDQFGTPYDFIGHVADDGFVIVTIPETAGSICVTVTERFRAEELTVAQSTGLLKLEVNAVSSYDGPFTDIREIARRLAEHRLSRSQLAECPAQFYGAQSQASDLNYYYQLADQVALWQAAPNLAQALLEAERLVMAKVPEVNRLKILLDLVEPEQLPPETLDNLRRQQQLCYLAGENIEELLCKIRRYQEFEPAALLDTLARTANLWPDFRLNVTPPPAAAGDLRVAVPELKLQQLIYNICRWLRYERSVPQLGVSLTAGAAGVELGFELPEPRPEQLDPSTLLSDLKQNQAGTLYGYLAQKILARYGGQMTLADGRLQVGLPVIAANQAAADPSPELKELRAKTREYRIFLDQHKRLAKPAELFDEAADLIDPLAADLLVEIEAMQSLVNSTAEIEPQVYPWSAILHNLRFFRMLALELRRNRPLIPAPVNLKSLLESVKPLVAHRLIDHRIVIVSDADRPVVNSDQTRLLQIFVSLALNALEAMPERGTLTFRISSDDYYTVEVIDTGRGIAWELLPHVFDPHVTTKGSGRGAGLYNVKMYVQQLNGQIDIASRIGEGTTVTVKLPPSWGAGYF